MDHPHVSVLIPAFETGPELLISLASVQYQTLEDWECILVDDGSSVPVELPRGLASDPRFRVVRHEENRGRGAARATALSHARGELVAWLDADDWCFPLRLETQAGYLESHPEADFVGCASARVDREEQFSSIAANWSLTPRTLRLLDRPPVVHPSLMFRRRVIETLTYRERYRVSEDLDFLTRALSRFAFANIQDVLYAYRKEQSESVSKYFQSTLTRMRVVREHAARRPLGAARWGLVYPLRLVAFTLMSWTGMSHLQPYRRMPPPGPQQLAHFAETLQRLHSLAQELRD